MVTSRAVLGCAALCALAAPPVRADEASLAFDAKVDALVEQARAEDATARKKALDGLRALGAPAMPQILRSVGRSPGSPEWESAVAVLVALDPAQALAHVETMRSEWEAWGWRETSGPDRGRAPRRVADELIDRLVAARSSEWTKPVRLEPATLEDPFHVPPWAEHVVEGTLPSSLLWTDVAVREKGAKLEIDTGGDGSFATRADPAKPLVVSVGSKERPRRALVYRRAGRWRAAPCGLLRGTADGTLVELLDVEADGDFAGASDLVRAGTDAFRVQRGSPFLWTPAGLVRFRVRRDAQGWTFSTLAEPEPQWMDGTSQPMAEALNAWRAAAGLAPQRVDRARTAACGLHHEYWKKHGFTDHREDRSKKEWTADGARAGQASSVWATGNGAAFVTWIAATILHRSSLLGSADEGAGAYAGGCGSLLWGGRIDAAAHGFPILVPGPGQSQVPPGCAPENPAPSGDPNFYGHGRAFPVSVTFSEWPAGVPADGRIELFEGASAKPLAGTTFSAAKPYHDSYTGGFPGDSVIFVADGYLRTNTVHTARFTGQGQGGPVEFAWQFRTK